MEMSGRPRRAALHQRSDSETNEIRTNPSLHSNNSSVSQKATDVSTWISPPVKTSISRDSTRSSSRTASTNSSRGPSGSINSLPPVPPLKIYKRESAFIVAKDSPSTVAGESPCSGTLVGGSDSSPNLTPPKVQLFPKSILKKPPRPALPPYTVEEYNRKSSSWVGSDSQTPTASQSRMNTRTLRIVRSEDDSDGEGEEFDVVGGLISRQRSTSFSPRVTPSPRFATNGESSAQGGRTFPSQLVPTRSPSDASLQRPATAGSLFASAKQLPAWARYFYGKKGGRGSIIEPDTSKDGGERVGTVDLRVRRQQSDDSMIITEVIPPGAVYPGPRRWASSESIPGLDWIGSRTRVMDPEVATQWSTPHLDHPPSSRFENIDRQLILFCLGFILPICWIIAAFLPLPDFCGHTEKQTQQTSGEPSSYNVDVEAQSNHVLQKKQIHENARWWRRVNQLLSGVGLAIIGAIIVLCVIAVVRGA